MKKVLNIMIMLVYLIILTGCFRTRTELFNLHIEEDTYTLHEDTEIFIDDEGNLISFISISFKNLDDIVSEDDDFDVNTFGDFSFEDIRLFEIELYLGLNDGDPIKYDLNFLGRANPGRGNAYRFSTTIDELKDEYKALLVVLELNTNIGGLDDRIGYIHLQFKNTKNLKVGATVTLRNNLETQREDALKLLTKIFSEFKRDNYDQEGWNQIHEIYRNTRASINKSLDSESITIFISQAIYDFSRVPTVA
jgi:hypothetical protein